MCLAACSDDISSTYSMKYRVRCDFRVITYLELFNTIGNCGQFATIKQSGTKITMKCASSENTYNKLADQKYFEYGNGGLIVGTTYAGELRAYDLSCRNCDRKDIRMNIVRDIYAKCPHCNIIYNLNLDGCIDEVPENCIHSKPRGLYQYRIELLGDYVSIHN